MKSVKAFAPATVANVCCGFDILGFSVEFPGDEVILTLKDEPGVRITKITGDQGQLPLEPPLGGPCRYSLLQIQDLIVINCLFTFQKSLNYSTASIGKYIAFFSFK